MKHILLFSILATVFISCSREHTLNYEIEVTYTNGKKDTLTGVKVAPKVGKGETMQIQMKRWSGSVCACISDGIFCEELIVCDIRKLKILYKKETW